MHLSKLSSLIGALAVFFGVATAPAFAQQALPSLIAQAVTELRARSTAFAFDMTNQTIAQSTAQTWRAHFDPARSGQKLQLVEPRELEGDQRRGFEGAVERTKDAGWCASEDIASGQNFVLVREDETSATYAFVPSPRSGNENSRRMAGRMRGEVTVTKTAPDISSIRYVSAAPFSPAPLVRIESINVSTRCDLAPNGRRYAAEFRE